MIAVCNNQKEIADVALRLGKILRRSLEAKGKPVSIEWELDLYRYKGSIYTSLFDPAYSRKFCSSWDRA